jgi:hypothetical protein
VIVPLCLDSTHHNFALTDRFLTLEYGVPILYLLLIAIMVEEGFEREATDTVAPSTFGVMIDQRVERETGSTSRDGLLRPAVLHVFGLMGFVLAIMGAMDGSVLRRSFIFLQGDATMLSLSSDKDDRWMIAVEVGSTCYLDDALKEDGYYDGPCQEYPFHLDRSMKATRVFAVIAVSLAGLSCIGAMVAFTAIDNRIPPAPATHPHRYIPAMLMVLTAVFMILSVLLLNSNVLCHETTSATTSENELVVIVPSCRLGRGCLISIFASLCWLVCAVAVIYPIRGTHFARVTDTDVL